MYVSGVKMLGMTITRMHLLTEVLGITVTGMLIECCAAAPGTTFHSIAGLLTASTTILLFASTTMGSDWSGTNPLSLLPLYPLAVTLARRVRSAEFLGNENLQAIENQ